MIRTRTILAALALCGACATPRSAAPAKGEPPPAFAWELKRGGQVLYVAGSVHLGKAGALPLTPAMEGALSSSDALVVEVDAAKVDQAGLQGLIVSAGFLPEGEDLYAMLTPDDRAELARRFQAAGVAPAAAKRMRPWLASIMLIGLEAAKSGYQSEGGVDQQLAARARGEKKQIVELESAESQIRILANLPEHVAALMLEEMLRNRDAVDQSIGALADAWRRGDAQAMDALVNADLRKPEYAELYAKLILERNLRMADRIEELLQKPGRYFVVVGAAHVVGERGIVELLRARGFTVRQLGQGEPPPPRSSRAAPVTAPGAGPA